MLALRPFEKAAEARSAINHGFFSPLQGVGVGSDQVGIGDERCSIERPSAMQISCDARPRYPHFMPLGIGCAIICRDYEEGLRNARRHIPKLKGSHARDSAKVDAITDFRILCGINVLERPDAIVQSLSRAVASHTFHGNNRLCCLRIELTSFATDGRSYVGLSRSMTCGMCRITVKWSSAHYLAWGGLRPSAGDREIRTGVLPQPWRSARSEQRFWTSFAPGRAICFPRSQRDFVGLTSREDIS